MRKMTRIAMLAVAVLVAMCMALCSCSGGDESGSQTDSTGSSQSGLLSASDSVPADESDFDDSEEPNESEESEERENDKIVRQACRRCRESVSFRSYGCGADSRFARG